jgi:sodium transport system permease protein
MLNQALIVARKEIIDGVRDVRSVISSLMYALMGPVVVGLVAMSSRAGATPDARTAVLVGMMSVFALVAAFVGGMNVALDTVAGERERRSLLPLLLNPVPRLAIVMGKWLAVSAFAMAGLTVDLAGFSAVLAVSGIGSPPLLSAAAFGIFPLALFAAALQLLVSALCRGVKEAHTYLSLLVFVPMGAGMSLVFLPVAASGWRFLPVVGQQLQLELWMRSARVPVAPSLALGVLTAALALLLVWAAGKRFECDDVMYGN